MKLQLLFEPRIPALVGRGVCQQDREELSTLCDRSFEITKGDRFCLETKRQKAGDR
ncbi:hypothetical protein A0J48_019710 [Sphaerospermopsis aphanizomenoides BCCUSP55]|uniref:hypothetical protein n=1 Tax=Sphaerospermopsis aphanizomenoides TaxID=459663 RepID=UPI001905498C|nr:hypothetical protein [Sphaerospermopsis aphanizomenoides]MBK1989733.1 hypothetical protein [Sphaerospermopsis aphanizomenoides BCCUSP55]